MKLSVLDNIVLYSLDKNPAFDITTTYPMISVCHFLKLFLAETMGFVLQSLEQNKVLAHDKWVLGQEKTQLYGQLKQLESYV